MAEEKTSQHTHVDEFAGHVRNAGKAVVHQWASLIPEEFWIHGRTATREVLLAVRTVVDGAIDAIDPEAAGASAEQPKKKSSGKQKVELDD